MDRFIMRVRLDYPAAEDEKRLLLEAPGAAGEALARLSPVLHPRDVIAMQEAADRVHLSSELAAYMVQVAHETRRSPYLAAGLGISPRGNLAWRNVARAAALADGRDFALPDDLKLTAIPALAHRLVLANQLESTGRTREEAERVLNDILTRLPVPG
jgi:MoxR-like ATPase